MRWGLGWVLWGLMFLLGGCEWWYGTAEDGSDVSVEECERLSGNVDGLLFLDGRCFVIDDEVRVRGELHAGPGTEMVFGPSGGLHVASGGRFDAAGLTDVPVLLHPSADGSQGGFEGVVFEPGSAGSLRDTVVEGGGYVGQGGCGVPAPCVAIAPDADVDLTSVGLERCAGPGVSGEPLHARGVGCTDVGACAQDPQDEHEPLDMCVTGWGYCVEAGCEGDFEGSAVAEQACQIGQSRCLEQRFVQTCVGGQWESVTDCSDEVGGLTACRDFGGFPRCGLPGPAECLSLPSVVATSSVPACDEQGCPAYAAACLGAGEREDCNPLSGAAVDDAGVPASPVPLTACLHPETVQGTTITGLGPRWLRFVIYNWGGAPDTSADTVTFTLASEGDYGLMNWLPPRAGSRRRYCMPGLGYEHLAGAGEVSITAPMPDPGFQYELIIEVHAARPEGLPLQHGFVAFPEGIRLRDSPHWLPEAHKWKAEGNSTGPNGPGTFYSYPTCESQEGWTVNGVQLDPYDGLCIDDDGYFADWHTREVVEDLPDLSTAWRHSDPSWRQCHTWTLRVEYGPAP